MFTTHMLIAAVTINALSATAWGWRGATICFGLGLLVLVAMALDAMPSDRDVLFVAAITSTITWTLTSAAGSAGGLATRSLIRKLRMLKQHAG